MLQILIRSVDRIVITKTIPVEVVNFFIFTIQQIVAEKNDGLLKKMYKTTNLKNKRHFLIYKKVILFFFISDPLITFFVY